MKKNKKTSKRKNKKNSAFNINNNINIPKQLDNQAMVYSNNQFIYQNPQQIPIQSPGIMPPTGYNMYPQNPMPNQQYVLPQNAAIDYQHITNVNQIQHINIYQPEVGSLYLSIGCCFKIFPIIFLILGLGIIPLFVVVKGNNGYICTAIGVLFVIVSIVMMFRGYYSVYILMGANDLTITKKALCGKNTTTYGPGELLSIELSHDITHKYRKGRERKMHNYQLDITTSDNSVSTIFRVGQNTRLFTLEEINYFNYVVNFHIQTKMRI